MVFMLEKKTIASDYRHWGTMINDIELVCDPLKGNRGTDAADLLSCLQGRGKL